MNLVIKIVSCYTLLSVSSLVFGFEFDKDEFIELNEIADNISKRCPKEQCIIIGVGRSPTPFIAITQEKGETESINLPLSNFRYGLSEPPLNAETELKLFKHFDHIISSQIHLKSRAILLVDYAVLGNTITAARNYLQKYLKERNRKNIVSLLIITRKDRSPMIKKEHGYTDQDFFILEPQSKIGTYDWEKKYESVAEYNYYHISSIYPVVRNLNYHDLKSAIAVELRNQSTF